MLASFPSQYGNEACTFTYTVLVPRTEHKHWSCAGNTYSHSRRAWEWGYCIYRCTTCKTFPIWPPKLTLLEHCTFWYIRWKCEILFLPMPLYIQDMHAGPHVPPKSPRKHLVMLSTWLCRQEYCFCSGVNSQPRRNSAINIFRFAWCCMIILAKKVPVWQLWILLCQLLMSLLVVVVLFLVACFCLCSYSTCSCRLAGSLAGFSCTTWVNTLIASSYSWR